MVTKKKAKKKAAKKKATKKAKMKMSERELVTDFREP